ncbi:LysR substrate-binding domain-containing protein [Bradyrhizobium genosp. P]|uniref:LysR substrate-binding domain-containing protein n=1 Tax=Bradyrhizobium genosp. P TaxID=83641 RepID=UPI003CF16C46
MNQLRPWLPFFTSTVLLPALPEFKRRLPQLTLRIEATHQYADFNASRVDIAIRHGREHSAGLKVEPLVRVRGLPVCAPARVKAGLRAPADLSREVLIHVTTQPLMWPVWLKDAGLQHMAPPDIFGSTACRRCSRRPSTGSASRLAWFR